jgi:ATP-dependent exoDNAse (exonuclease V) alpha subunit
LLPVQDRIEQCCYKESTALHQLWDGRRIQLSKCRRSDDTLFNMLMPNNIGNLTKKDFGNKSTNRHICFTNKTRIAIKKMMMEKDAQQKKYLKPLELKALHFDPNSQDVKLVAGAPLIARKNAKDLNMFNNEVYDIKAIRHKTQIVLVHDERQTIEIPFDKFQLLFNPAYAITCHKSQGSTYNYDYTIHEFSRFDDRMKYVALSRATNIKHINIV